jgi:hypothetical protein
MEAASSSKMLAIHLPSIMASHLIRPFELYSHENFRSQVLNAENEISSMAYSITHAMNSICIFSAFHI